MPGPSAGSGPGVPIAKAARPERTTARTSRGTAWTAGGPPGPMRDKARSITRRIGPMRGPTDPSLLPVQSVGYRRTGAALDRHGRHSSSAPVGRARLIGKRRRRRVIARRCSGRPFRVTTAVLGAPHPKPVPAFYGGAWLSTGTARPRATGDASAGWCMASVSGDGCRVEHDLSGEPWTALKEAWGGCAYAAPPAGRCSVTCDHGLPAAGGTRSTTSRRPRFLQRQQVQRRSHRRAAAKRFDERAFLLRHLEITAALVLRFPAEPTVRPPAQRSN